ncbi:tetratricopeptide repeat protein [Halocatena marina]|uniref:tetratricopeptide repeat protein n=1 Tax=Halocatena marina TaxID=2934937 RepID=UPI00200BC31C|nr:tetratricopeptide repeat protein [Halocatena marina]
MTPSPSAADLLATIAQRSKLISTVVESDEPPTKQTLSNTLGLTRSTISEVTQNLSEIGLLESTGDSIAPTLFAVLVWETYEAFTQRVADIGPSDGDTVLWPTAVERQEVMQLIAARLDILECIQTPHNKRDLVAKLPISRSTVDRALRELEMAELIAWTNDGYVTTVPGKQATKQYRSTVESMSDILAAQEVLSELPHDSSISPALCTDATVAYAADAPPYHLPAGVRDHIVSAQRVRVYIPVLATPQFLDCCQQQVIHDGMTLELLLSSALLETLSAEFPGPLGAISAVDHCTVFRADTAPDSRPPFGLILAETETATSVSVIVYGEHRTIHGTIHNGATDAIQWAEETYVCLRDEATDVTDELRALIPAEIGTAVGSVPLTDTERVALEGEGFVQLTPEYFAQREPAPPVTTWRTGFDLVDVHAGYAIDRDTTSDEMRHNLTESLTARLEAGSNLAVLGSPGSGKSTVCQSVACRWYEQGIGPVFYRESGRGMTMPLSSVLGEHLRAADGHALVVVEDAVRAEANAIFQLMRAFSDVESVTFLLDTRDEEWKDPKQLPTDAKLEAYRHEAIETVSVPTFDVRESKRLVRQFEQTIDSDLDSGLVSRLREITGVQSAGDDHIPLPDSPGKLLLFLHHLVLSIDPLAAYDTSTTTSLVEDVQRTYEDLHAEGELALDVGVFVNLLNAAGIGVSPELICALAPVGDESEIDAIRDQLSSLEGRIIFARGDTAAGPYRTPHEEWSSLFLDHLLSVDTERSASRRVGRCITALLSLADEADRRDWIQSVLGEPTPVIEQIASAPDEWSDATVEQLFGLGRRRRGLTALFGQTGDSWIDLPKACSLAVTVNCTRWRALMAREAGDLDRAAHEFDALDEFADEIKPADPEWAARLRGQRLNGLGLVAWRRGEYDSAETYYTQALEHYRTADATRRLAQTRMNLGGVAYFRGDLETAETHCRWSLGAYRDLGRKEDEAIAMSNLAGIVEIRGKLDRAIDYYQQCLAIAREVGARENEAKRLHNLGSVIKYQTDLDTADSYCTQSLELAREFGISNTETDALYDLGQISQIRGDLGTAATYYRQSLEISQEIDQRRLEAWNLAALGTLARVRNDLETAVELCTKAYEISQEIGERRLEARSLIVLGRIACERDKLQIAEEHARDSLSICQETGDFRGKARCYRLLGRVARHREQFTTANNHLTRALNDFHEEGYGYEEAESRAALGSLARDQSDKTTACEWFETAVDLYRDIGAVRDTIDTAEQLAAVCETLGKFETALAHCEMAYDLAQDTDFLDVNTSLDEQRARLVEKLGDDDSA